jgi:hypothetical protein
MILFLQQFDGGNGDYARERHEWADRTTLEDLKKLAAGKPKRRRGGR